MKDYKELFNAPCYEESAVLESLHEIGHIISKHKGNTEFNTLSTSMNEKFEKRIQQTPLRETLDDPYEKEVWDFVLNARGKNRDYIKGYQNRTKTGTTNIHEPLNTHKICLRTSLNVS